MTFVERTTRQLGINFPAVKTVIDFIKAKLSMNSIVSFGITTPAYYRATEEEARITREYLMKIKNKCRELDAELILVMIPEHIGNYDNADKRETLKGLCAEAGITRTIDLFPLFKDALDEVYLEYDGHFSQKGHQALADILVDYMLDHNLIARGEPTGK
jgi:lysophospholipase L1-like esterase